MKYAEMKIAIIGTGITGRSCAQFLHAEGAHVHMFDTRAPLATDISYPVEWGAIDVSRLIAFELIVVSPGVSLATPAIQAAMEAGIDVVGDVELFARENRNPVIAVTGSNGKSTVVSLLGAIFNSAGLNASVVGNIGTPVLQAWQAVKDNTEHCLIMELSSFQLESTRSLRANAAVILNISEDHLDRHNTMTEYTAAKRQIFNHAEQCIVNRDDQYIAAFQPNKALTFGLSESGVGMSWDAARQVILYNGKDCIDVSKCSMYGEHNVLNMQAATLLALSAGVGKDAIQKALQTFTGLPHRYQRIATHHSVRWINDSKATNPGAAMASISAARHQTDGRLVVILGGDAKGADLNSMRQQIQRDVDYVVALGKDGRVFLDMNDNSVYVDSMLQAVRVADAIAKSNDTVLLAPACASLDMYTNFEHRGDAFVEAVEALAA